VVIALLGACGSGAGDTVLDVVFDPCEPVPVVAPTATAEQLASIDDAIAMWRADGAGAIAREPASAAPALEVRFEEAAGNFHGVYEDEIGVIYVNATLTDRGQRAITIAHEIGHALGLWHVSPDTRISVMNPGNLTVAPNPGDREALVQLWGDCPPQPPVDPPAR